MFKVAGAESTIAATAAVEAELKSILFNSVFVAYVEDAEIWVRYILEAELLVKYVDKSAIADAISTHSVFSLFQKNYFLSIKSLNFCSF